MKVALHSHSTLSDGSSSPEIIISLVKEQGCDICAITDHDTITLPENIDGIFYMPSAEFTADDFSNFHILGYNIQNTSYVKALYRFLNNLNEEKMKMVIERLKDQNIKIDYEEVKSFANGKAVNKAIIKRYLVVKNYVPSCIDAYKKYIGKGRPAYVKSRDFNAKFLLNMITACGGVSVLAHPSKIKINGNYINKEQLDILINKLKTFGLKGIEVYNDKTDEKVNEYLVELCHKYELIPLIGSDYHEEKHNLILNMNNKDLNAFLSEVNSVEKNYSIENVKQFHQTMAKPLLDIKNQIIKEKQISRDEFTL